MTPAEIRISRLVFNSEVRPLPFMHSQLEIRSKHTNNRRINSKAVLHNSEREINNRKIREKSKIWSKTMKKWPFPTISRCKVKFQSPSPSLSCKVPKHMTPLKRCRRSASNFRFTVNVVIQS